MLKELKGYQRECLECGSMFVTMQESQYYCKFKSCISLRNRKRRDMVKVFGSSKGMKTFPQRKCKLESCGILFSPKQANQKFCTTKHGKKFSKKQEAKKQKARNWDIFHRDGFRCRYCGKTAKEVLLVVDHICPVKKGGKSEFGNMITSCEGCNLSKKAKLMSPQLLFQLWDEAHGEFSYVEVRRYWEKHHYSRVRRINNREDK